jgi:cytochrome c-type biogenesis protein CcmH
MRTRSVAVLVGLIASLVALLLPAAVVFAQQATPSDDEVNAIARPLYCPVCENIPLDVCPTQACAQWRELIREKLAAGWTEQQIKDYFVEQYGDRVLGTPPARGLNWLAYLIPPAAILAGTYVLIKALRIRKVAAGQAPAAVTVPPPADEYVSRLEEEVRKR